MSMSLNEFLLQTNFWIIWYFLMVNIGYIILLFSSIPDIFRRFRETEKGNLEMFIQSKLLPPICALVPAYNEEEVITNTIESLLKTDYPSLDICVINDGSEDETMALLTKRYDLTPISPSISQHIETKGVDANFFVSKIYPNLRVIDKEHSGKSDSLNMGINTNQTPLFLSVDADTLVEPSAISRLAYGLLSKPHTIAEGGSIYVLNGCKYEEGKLIEPKMSFLPLVAMQTCEYLRAFIYGRIGWLTFRGPLILSGALTLFERQAVQDIGGYNPNAPGEDMEVVVGLHEYMRANKFPYQVGYSLSAAAWTNVPTDMNAIWSQRDRWHRGLVDSLMRHLNMFFNPKYGATGLLAYPFQFFAEFLGPIVELIGYIAVCLAMYFNLINWQFAVLFFITTWGFSTVITLAATMISMVSFNKYKRLRDIVLLLFLVVFENFGYRQIMSFCRFFATIRHFFKKLFHSEKSI